MKSVTSPVMITSLLAASLLAFCAPQPASVHSTTGRSIGRTWSRAWAKRSVLARSSGRQPATR